jgi:amino acid permease
MVKVELTKPIERRIKKIFFRAIFWEMCLYIVTAFAGYLSFLDKTDKMIIDRPDIPGYKDYLMLVGRIGTLILMLVSIIVIIAPCRQQIFTFMGITRKSRPWEHFLLTLFLYTSQAGIAIEVPQVISAFAFVGGSGGVIATVFFPMWIYVARSKKRWY